MTQKTLREDAHSREEETCHRRPRSARECARAHSFLCHRKLRPMTQKRSARMRSDSVKNMSAYAD